MHNIKKIIFRPTKWLKLIEKFQDNILEKNSITVFCADAGCGKSTFAEVLKQNMAEHYYSSVIKAKSSLKLKNIFKNINIDFDWKKNNLDEFIQLINEQKKHVLLIIDDAHLLSMDILRNIEIFFQKLQEENKYFHIVMVSTKDLLISEALNYALGNLSLVETTTYIKFLAKKHLKSPTNKQIQQIFLDTEGKISDINNYLKDLNSHTKKVSNNILVKFLITMALLFGGFFISYGRYIWSQEVLLSFNAINIVK